MITSASADASAGVRTRRPCSSAFSRLFAQGQRVRVTLAAVAQHGDLPALDHRQVGVIVVVDLGGHVRSFQQNG
jgi:hypothetical protein